MLSTTTYRTTWLFLLFAIAAVPSFAQNAAVDATADTQSVAADQKAAIDPSTGRLRGITPEEARALIDSVSRQLNQSADGLTIVYHPTGMISIDLEDRFQSTAFVRM